MICAKTLCKDKDIYFSDVFNNSAVLDMDETGSNILFESGLALKEALGFDVL